MVGSIGSKGHGKKTKKNAAEDKKRRAMPSTKDSFGTENGYERTGLDLAQDLVDWEEGHTQNWAIGNTLELVEE